METRQCKRCKRDMTLDHFDWLSVFRGKLSWVCKNCTSPYMKTVKIPESLALVTAKTFKKISVPFVPFVPENKPF